MLSKELVAASTVPLVLSVLAEGQSYGYAVIQRVRELSQGRIQFDLSETPIGFRLARSPGLAAGA